jgi:hypothetical protein
MSEPYSGRVGYSLLSGHFVCPALMALVAVAIGPPIAPDWDGSAPACLISFLFVAHLCYGAGLVVFLRGWRLLALVVSIFSLPLVCFVCLWACIYVTGVPL